MPICNRKRSLRERAVHSPGQPGSGRPAQIADSSAEKSAELTGRSGNSRNFQTGPQIVWPRRISCARRSIVCGAPCGDRPLMLPLQKRIPPPGGGIGRAERVITTRSANFPFTANPRPSLRIGCGAKKQRLRIRKEFTIEKCFKFSTSTGSLTFNEEFT